MRKPINAVQALSCTSVLALLSLAAVGCGEEAPPPKSAADVPAEPTPEPPPPAVDSKATDDPKRSQINISEMIKQACGITDAEASFGYDSSRVQSGDHPVLDKLAECFISGPLKGRAMRLVGHADPRGEPEYNLALGNQRADNVKSYLVGRGLKDAQGETTSRGEMDATGTDEASWAEDRRVDIVLVE